MLETLSQSNLFIVAAILSLIVALFFIIVAITYLCRDEILRDPDYFPKARTKIVKKRSAK